MFKLNLIAAAVLTALCANSFAADNESFSLEADSAPSIELAAVAQTSVVSRTTLVTAVPTKAEALARSYQPWLNQIKKPYANQLGTGNGAGVTVGVVDSGVQVDHPELKGQVSASYNAITGGADVTDQMGHGTHVAGLIAGSLANGSITEGLAPGAKLVMAKVFTTGSSDSGTIGKGIDWVVNVQKAPILSLSLGASSVAMQSNIQNAVAKGTLITAALGNDGNTKGASWPAEFAKASWAKGDIIAVGALDASNKRASFSNYDTTLANWTVYAPGVSIASSYSTPTMRSAYAYMSGTSMATPIVAGQAALIKSNWNFLGANDIANVIFQSATHLCSDTVAAATCAARTTADSVYGWGLINVGASLQPIGGLNLGVQKGAMVTYAGTAISTPKSGLAAGLSGVNTVAVDKFNRGFTVNLATVMTSAGTQISSTPVASGTVTVLGKSKFSAEYATQTTAQSALGLGGAQGALVLAKSSYSFTNDKGTSYAFGIGSTEKNFFGLESTGSTPLSLSGEGSRFNAPYFGLADNATHVGYGMTFSDGTVLRLGTMVQSAQVGAVLLGSAAVTAGSKTLTSVEFQKNFGKTTGVLTLGRMQEADSMLGLSGAGALALAGSTSTNFVTFAGSRPLGEKTTLSAMASVGQTAAYANSSASMIDGTTGSTSAAWSLGLAQKDVLRTGDSFGLTVAMPLRTMSGSMRVTTAVSQSQADGSLQYATQSVGLSPSGHQHDFELAYATPVSFGGSVTAVAQLKTEPGHDAGAASQYGVGIKYVKAF